MVPSPLLLTGVGLRPAHYQAFLTTRPKVAWLEVHSEEYFGESNAALLPLTQLRATYPISLHGVGLSLGSSDALNWAHLRQLHELIEQVDPCLVSDHLAWSSLHGQHLHDLLPLPYTEEALTHLCQRIDQVQNYLQRSILIENISNYISFTTSMMPEWAFLKAVATNTGCGILLDINNLYVSASNLGFSATDYLYALPAHLIQEIHLAGFSKRTIQGKEVLIDTHSTPIDPAVWALFALAIQHLGPKPTLIEWDAALPALHTLVSEAAHADALLRGSHELSHTAS